MRQIFQNIFQTMKKIILLILLSLSLLVLGGELANAGVVNIPGSSEIRDASLDIPTSGNTLQDVSNTGFSILAFVKWILMAVMIIYIVYAWAMMVMSMGSDEEQLSGSKRQLWYALIALIFINIPGTLYEAFYKDGTTRVGSRISDDAFWEESTESSGNILFDFFVFENTLNDQIVLFLEVAIFAGAVFFLTLAGVTLVTSRWREDRMKEAKEKLIYTILALVFVGIIEAWKWVAFWGSIESGINLFESLANLALFFAAPVAIFFLTLAGYYYVGSNGEEEQVKKAKSIVVSTILATLILLAAYTFLLDLATI